MKIKTTFRLLKQYQELKVQINEIEKMNKQLESKLEKMKEHEFDPKCKYCMKYSITVDKIQYSNELKENKDKLDKMEKEEKKLGKRYQKERK